jgi:hypothetical protein
MGHEYGEKLVRKEMKRRRMKVPEKLTGYHMSARWHKRRHNPKLTTEQRKILPSHLFVFPKQRKYPIDTPERARTAIAYAMKYHGPRSKVTRRVRRAVYRKYPDVFERVRRRIPAYEENPRRKRK